MTRRRTFFRLVGGGLLLAAGLGAAETPKSPPVFRAGAAIGDITPELGQPIVGGFVAPPATSIHDPLHVRALVLDDGTHRLALVVCDNLGMPREFCDEAKRVTHQLTGLAGEHLLLSATHTHSGPSAGAEAPFGYNSGKVERAHGAVAVPAPLTAYQRFLAQRIAETVRRAIDQLEPARIGWGRTEDPAHVFNRRWFVSEEAHRRNPFGGIDTVRMNPPAAAGLIRPAGPTDPEISFISVQARSGRPLALYAVYPLHYVGGIPAGVISADYYGVFCQRLGELLGGTKEEAPAFVGMLANGTSGDINNINTRSPRPAQPPYVHMTEVAHAVAADVQRVYREINYHDWVPLTSRAEELTVATRRPSPEMVERAQAIVDGKASGPPWHPLEKLYAGRVLQRAQAPERVDLSLQVFRIGDAGLMSVPAEAFAEMGLKLKARAPFKLPIPVGIANGYSGYLPTVEQHKLGGYESWIGTNRLEIEASPKISAALLRMAAELQAK